MSTQYVTEFFEVSRPTLTNWREAGCPQVKRGRWDLKEVFDWWWKNIASDRAAAEGGDASINEAKRQYWWGQAEEKQLKVSQAKGELIEIEEVYNQWAKRSAEYKNGAFGLINSLPPLLEGKSQPEMRGAIEEHVWGMFDRVVRYGKFCKAQPQMKSKKSQNKK